MNRTIHFSAVFLVLLALVFLLSDQFSRLSAPPPVLEPEKTIDRTAVEKATLINSPVAIGPLRDPVEIRVPANYEAVDSSFDSAINKVTRRLRRMQHHLKDRLRPAFIGKAVSRPRPTANLVTQIHSWLVGEFGLGYTTNGHPWKQNRTNGRRFKKQPAIPRLVAAGFKVHGN
jgi:hypothetical protein